MLRANAHSEASQSSLSGTWSCMGVIVVLSGIGLTLLFGPSVLLLENRETAFCTENLHARLKPLHLSFDLCKFMCVHDTLLSTQGIDGEVPLLCLYCALRVPHVLVL